MSARTSVYENKVLLTKPFQASQSWQFMKTRSLCRHCLQNEWTLTGFFSSYEFRFISSYPFLNFHHPVVISSNNFICMFFSIWTKMVSSADDTIFYFTILTGFHIITNYGSTDNVERADCYIIHYDTIGQSNFFVDLAICTDNTIFDGCLFSYVRIFTNKTF